MSHDQMSPQNAELALDEVERRRSQTVAAGNRDWTWPWVGFICAVLLVMGVGFDRDWFWLVALCVGAGFAGSFRAVRLRRGAGPGLGFQAALMVVMVVVLILFQGVWLAFDLAYPTTIGMVGACLVLLAGTPFAQRRIARR